MGCQQAKEKALANGSSRPGTSVPPTPGGDSQVSIGNIVSMLITSDQKSLIAKTWQRLAQDKVTLAMRVFKVIFSRQPEVKALFPFRDYEGEALTSHPLFRAHASHFIGVIVTAVENLDDLDGSVSPLLLRLGSQHASTPGFCLDYFEVFTQSLVTVWEDELGATWSPEVRSAWEKLFLFVMMELRAGYQRTIGSSRGSVNTPQDSLQSGYSRARDSAYSMYS